MNKTIANKGENMNSKIYTATVFEGENQKLMDVKSKSGLKALVESFGLSYCGVQKIYAEKGNQNQIHMEWCEIGPWTEGGIIREHIYLHAK